ncbi:hypothetical protein AWR36_005555 [Microbulbifer flavimaris]|uniref:PepSY domain-containing protein n=1 Tax=Microbulbifer flavimaris TaxID=1781068 RepID=A0ABX4HZI6_9GAMM|nr:MULTISPECIES: hypothetical protein [Microbulbifer]KUJ83331.1 hypothetical protein AVO43_05545 [Microbulbifer sp. ZGT114]PCO05486.1 hypothetical protein AWR36_005555 [Microbulbifer flavimaris]
MMDKRALSLSLIFLLTVVTPHGYTEVENRSLDSNLRELILSDLKVANGGDLVDAGIGRISVGTIASSKNLGRPVEIRIGAFNRQVVLSEVINESESGLVHIKGKVRWREDSYVRFTLRRESIITADDSGQRVQGVSGVVREGDSLFRIRPVGENLQNELIYRPGETLKNRPLWLSGDSLGEKRARVLEAAGLRFDKFGKAFFGSYEVDSSGELLRIQAIPEKLGLKPGVAIEEIVAKLSIYMPFVGGEKWDLSEITPWGDRIRYDFSQEINGIPVEGAFLRIWVNKKNKLPVIATAQVVMDFGLKSKPELSWQEAQDILDEYTRSRGHVVEPVEESAILRKLIYRRVGSDKVTGELFWMLSSNTGEISPVYYVSAETGEIVSNFHSSHALQSDSE